MIGLTGGIGCGKSTVTQVFKRLGFATMDTDMVVRSLLETDEQVLLELREQFGDCIFCETGAVDRVRLAELVFTDELALNRLELILHPRVRDAWTSAIQAQPQRSWCIEIPLLFEKNLEKSFIYSLCVYSSRVLQLARLAAKGMDCQHAQQRIAAQLPLEEKARRADFVLMNDGALAFTERQVIYLHELLKK